MLTAEKSQDLPFMNRPPLLDGSMAGNVGIDPLGQTKIDDMGTDLCWLRQAELKHGGVGMLTVTGFRQGKLLKLFRDVPGC